MFVKTVSVRSLSALAIIGAFLLCLALSGGVIAIRTAASNKELPIYSVSRSDKKISISFDAAWGNEDTQDLIDIMGKYNVKTTFFVVGMWVDKYPESVKALSDAGHEIMNHSNTHPHLTRLDADGIQAEVNNCADKIEEITGKRPTLLRPPYGDYDNKVITTLRGMGVSTIQWDVDSLDWKGISADEITKRVLSGVKDGSIVLFHNAGLHTSEALPAIIEKLQADGYEIVPVSELIYYDNYTIDHTGKQISSKTEETANNEEVA